MPALSAPLGRRGVLLALPAGLLAVVSGAGIGDGSLKVERLCPATVEWPLPGQGRVASARPGSSGLCPAFDGAPLGFRGMTAIRLRLDLAYDGTGFAGWAGQPRLRTVQAELTAALTTVLRAAGPVRLTVAGRTDAGVHARGQVAHVDVDPEGYALLSDRSDRTLEAVLVSRLGGILRPDIVVRRVSRAPDGFDARFSALERRYLYRIADPAATRDPLRRHDTLWWRRPLDVDAMNAASGQLVGLRDFAAFCKRREGATTIRTLLEYSWVRLPDGVLVATVRADAFCHSMVRSLVGAAVAVGEGKHPVDWPRLRQRGGERAGILVLPPHGLSLEEVCYPADADLADRATAIRARRTPDDPRRLTV